MRLGEIRIRKRTKLQKLKMLDGIDNIIDMPLRLNESTPTFQTIRELPGIERKTRSRLAHQ